MTIDISKWPVLVLMENISKWAKSAQGRHFWEDFTKHKMWAERLRQDAKSIIVWL